MRTFVAIELPEEIRREIGKVQDMLKKDEEPSRIKWVEVENIHLTLKFLGELSAERVQDLSRGVEEALVGYSPFPISFKEIGAFPNWGRARVIWIGVEEGKEGVTRIQRKIEDSLARLQFEPEERSFQPHITIGRVKEGRGILKNPGVVFKSEPFPVGHVSIMKSTLTPKGPIYERIRVVPLKETS